MKQGMEVIVQEVILQNLIYFGDESGTQIVPAEVIMDVEAEVKNQVVRRGLPA